MKTCKSLDLCLSYNKEDTGVLYAEMYNDNLLKSVCLINGHNSMKHVFNYSERKHVNFAITSEKPACELFLTAQPYSHILYDVFYVSFHPCPLRFKLQHGICDCDPDLKSYIHQCEIHTQTIEHYSNVYILGAVSNSSSKLSVVSILLLSTEDRRINLNDKDAQCQLHRTAHSAGKDTVLCLDPTGPRNAPTLIYYL